MQEEKMKTGTTTLGMVCKDGVILASESKSTLGFLVASKEAEKVYKLDENMAITTAGGSGDSQALVRLMKAEIKIYKLTRNADFTVTAASTLLSNMLQSSRFYPYMAMLILGGVDKDGPRVFTIDAVGGAENEKYAATGSGSPMAYGVLEDKFREDLTMEEGIELAVRAIKSARERDIFSGGKNIVVATIDKNGVKFVDKEKINQIAK